MKTHSIAGVAFLVVAMCESPAASAQTLVDGIVAKVNTDIVTMSDVRQARFLKLVPLAEDSDTAAVEALIDRRLLLAEVARYTPAEPSAADIAAVRRQWLARLGSGADVPQLLARAGMSETALQSWLRDDVRIQKYLDQRFAPVSGDRAEAIRKWIDNLRSRAAIEYVKRTSERE